MGADDDLGGIMDRALRAICQECGAEAPLRAANCPECGAVMVDDEANRMSLREAGETPPPAEGSTLERRANFVLLQKAGDGVLSGEMSVAEYVANVKKLQQIARNGLSICGSTMFVKKMSEASDDAKRAGDLLKRAFEQLQEGLDMMERYAETQSYEDLRLGRSIAEVAFAQLHEIEEGAANLK